jgi:hypothetical protein
MYGAHPRFCKNKRQVQSIFLERLKRVVYAPLVLVPLYIVNLSGNIVYQLGSFEPTLGL